MSALEECSGLSRAIVMTLRWVSLLLIVRVFGKWLMADTVSAWLNWLRTDWAAELGISVLAAAVGTIWTVFGSTNGYIDRG